MDTVLKIIFSCGLPLGIIVYVLLFPEKAKIISSWLWKAVNLVWKKAEYRIVANDIEGRINEFSKKFNSDLVDTEPYGIKIEWVTKSNKEAFIRDGKVIIRMENHKNQNKNIIVATVLFVSKITIPIVRQFLTVPLRKSIDLFTAKKMLAKHKREILELFFEEYYHPEVQSEPEIEEFFEKYQLLDDKGLFTPVLIQELIYLGKKIYFKKPTTDLISEILEFISFLETIANKQIREDVPLQFNRNIIKVAIILVAREETKTWVGIPAYTRRLDKVILANSESIYVYAWEKSIPFAKRISQDFEKDNRIIKKKEFTHTIIADHKKQEIILSLFRNRAVEETIAES